MSRDYRKLLVFREADSMVLRIYPATMSLPIEERYGLQSQIRRAAVSCAANMVEGSSRKTTADFCRFLEMAHGSAREVAYLLSIARRLSFIDENLSLELEEHYDSVQRMLHRLIAGLAD